MKRRLPIGIQDFVSKTMPKNKTYTLKHKNVDVGVFTLNGDTASVIDIEIYNDIYSPINARISKVEQAVDFNSWLDNRCIPNSREDVERLKNVYKITNLKELMLARYGLSLSDHFWMKKEGKNSQWEHINYFDNRYSENLGKIAFDSKFKGLKKNNESPDPALNGSLRKRWEYNTAEKKSYLLKGGTGVFNQEPFNEYFASLLMDYLEFDHVPYWVQNEGDSYISICPCIIDTKTEMMSAWDIIKKYGVKKDYKSLLALARQRGLNHFKDDIHKMIVIDYIIGNTDRHWFNFGIVKNADSGEWIKAIPIFDNGSSLWACNTVTGYEETHSSSFKSTNEKNVDMINLNAYITKEQAGNLLEIFETAFAEYGKNNSEQKKRKLALRKGLREKTELIQKRLDDINRKSC